MSEGVHGLRPEPPMPNGVVYVDEQDLSPTYSCSAFLCVEISHHGSSAKSLTAGSHRNWQLERRKNSLSEVDTSSK